MIFKLHFCTMSSKREPRQSPRFSFCLFPLLDFMPTPPLRAKRGIGTRLPRDLVSEQRERVVRFKLGRGSQKFSFFGMRIFHLCRKAQHHLTEGQHHFEQRENIISHSFGTNDRGCGYYGIFYINFSLKSLEML